MRKRTQISGYCTIKEKNKYLTIAQKRWLSTSNLVIESLENNLKIYQMAEKYTSGNISVLLSQMELFYKKNFEG